MAKLILFYSGSAQFLNATLGPKRSIPQNNFGGGYGYHHRRFVTSKTKSIFLSKFTAYNEKLALNIGAHVDFQLTDSPVQL